MQKDDYIWFIANYKRLFDKYGKGFLVIKDKNVLGKYKTLREGYRETLKQNVEGGTFIVQECKTKDAPELELVHINSFYK